MTPSFHDTERVRVSRLVVGRGLAEVAYREALGLLATLAGARAGGRGR